MGLRSAALRRHEPSLVGVGLGVEGRGLAGHSAPRVWDPFAARCRGSIRVRAAFGQVEAKWMRTRAAFSITETPVSVSA